MPLGKDTAIALRKERLAYQLEDAIGETEANKSKKRTTLSSTEMFVDLDSVVSYWQISSVHFIVHVQLCCYPGLFTPLAVQLHHDSLQLRHEQEDQGLVQTVPAKCPYSPRTLLFSQTSYFRYVIVNGLSDK